MFQWPCWICFLKFFIISSVTGNKQISHYYVVSLHGVIVTEIYSIMITIMRKLYFKFNILNNANFIETLMGEDGESIHDLKKNSYFEIICVITNWIENAFAICYNKWRNLLMLRNKYNTRRKRESCT